MIFDMYVLNFSKNWNNKLSCNYYTTIRRHSSQLREGMTVEIHLAGKFLHYAEIAGIMTMELYLIPVCQVCQDTGYSYDKSLEMLRRLFRIDNTQQLRETNVDLIYLKIIKK